MKKFVDRDSLQRTVELLVTWVATAVYNPLRMAVDGWERAHERVTTAMDKMREVLATTVTTVGEHGDKITELQESVSGKTDKTAFAQLQHTVGELAAGREMMAVSRADFGFGEDGDLALHVTESVRLGGMIALWNAACGDYGAYDTSGTDTSRPFRLNGLWLTKEEAARVLDFGHLGSGTKTKFQNVRTNLRPLSNGSWEGLNLKAAFVESGVEVVNVEDRKGEITYASALMGAFVGCEKLREVLGIINCDSFTSVDRAFERCKKLETVKLKGLKCGVSWADSPLLTFDTVAYAVTNKYDSTTAITLTLHPTAYSRLTAMDEWDNLLPIMAQKKVTVASA